MGQLERVKKINPLFSFAKSFAKSLICLSLTACSLFNKKGSPDAQVAKAFNEALQFRPVGDPQTSSGENESPSWSPSGEAFLFISRNRPQHKNFQVYEKNILTGEEKRITYSDGDTFNPIYFNSDQEIIYSSTTDELKERPLLFKTDKGTSAYPPADLYESNLSGTEISRLTLRPGFDGNISLSSNNKNEIYVQSAFDSVRKIVRFNVKSKSSAFVFNDNFDRKDFVQFKEKYAWIQTSPTQQIFIADKSLKNPTLAPLIDLIAQDLDWVSDNFILMSASLKNRPYFQIYAYKIDEKCLIPIVTADQVDLRQPKISFDRKKILFVSNQINGKNQIMMKNIDWEHLKCAPTETNK